MRGFTIVSLTKKGRPKITCSNSYYSRVKSTLTLHKFVSIYQLICIPSTTIDYIQLSIPATIVRPRHLSINFLHLTVLSSKNDNFFNPFYRTHPSSTTQLHIKLAIQTPPQPLFFDMNVQICQAGTFLSVLF